MKRLFIFSLCLIFSAALTAQTEILNVNGSLDASAADESVEWFQLNPDRGAFLSAEAVSLDFTPRILIQSPDGQIREFPGRGSSARATFFALDEEGYRVGVALLDQYSGSSGSFILKVQQAEANASLEGGATLRGELESSDSWDPVDERYIDWYPVNLEAGVPHRILLESSEFDAFMYLQYPDGKVETMDDGRGRDSVITLLPPEEGRVMVGASSYSGSDTGRYFLSMEILEDLPELQSNRSIQGRLDSSSGSSLFAFQPDTAGAYRISLESDDFDSILRVRGADGMYLENDDMAGAGGTNSALAFSARAGERILVEAASWSGGGGEFRLEVSSARSIALGEDIEAQLPGASEYQLSGEAGDFISVEVVSNDFDTVLQITDSRGNIIEDDDSPSDDWYYRSRLIYYFPEDESLALRVSSYSGNEEGSYILRSRVMDMDPPEDYPRGHTLSRGESILGMISPDDETFDLGSGDVYSIEARAGEQIRITMESDDLDSYLTLIAPDGGSYSDDDSLGDYNAEIDIAAPADGTYQLIASAYGQNTGLYNLEYSSSGQLDFLLNETGEISDDDRRDIRGVRFDAYDISLVSGQEVSIRLSSQDFDTRLYVNDPQGDSFAENDDYAGTNSRVDIVADQSGEYRIVVMSFYEDARGEYQIQVLE
ncbi:PPC domain-containing protein [Salinispira pacifica]|uniref:Bacterial pre-peptidase C-terminal domain protein n=1 Tax=Salinispira pacifica TaxID=1307761 RepID=V5WGH5_9SPIO|nr:PPC domain-containing protein [Salinispira pacifica]AHC14266.1 bacterial pre-peptidase C-terminal domain protein [Salinispira pacifica]